MGAENDIAVEVFDLATGELRELNQRLHDLNEDVAKTP